MFLRKQNVYVKNALRKIYFVCFVSCVFLRPRVLSRKWQDSTLCSMCCTPWLPKASWTIPLFVSLEALSFDNVFTLISLLKLGKWLFETFFGLLWWFLDCFQNHFTLFSECFQVFLDHFGVFSDSSLFSLASLWSPSWSPMLLALP